MITTDHPITVSVMTTVVHQTMADTIRIVINKTGTTGLNGHTTTIKDLMETRMTQETKGIHLKKIASIR